jgi:hypothetical protein
MEDGEPAANGGEQRLLADPRTIPAQPNVVISGMAAFALVDPVTASKYGVALHCRGCVLRVLRVLPLHALDMPFTCPFQALS